MIKKYLLYFAVPATLIIKECPDCPILISLDDKEVEKTMKMGLEKFNKESALPNYFAPLNITRAISQVRTCPKHRKEHFQK